MEFSVLNLLVTNHLKPLDGFWLIVTDIWNLSGSFFLADESIKQLELTPDFYGYTEYRDAAISIAEFFKDLSDNGYLSMVEVFRKDRLTQEDVNTFNSVIGQYNNKMPELIGHFNTSIKGLIQNSIPQPASPPGSK